jgi:predicted amidophosphoribosyltransferase
MGWSDEVHDLVWGTQCAGCARPGRQLCCRCGHLLATSSPVSRIVDGTDGALGCIAGATYDGLVARLVPAWKNDGRTGLTDPLTGRLSAALAQTSTEGEEVFLVPVPSRPDSLVRRGFSPPLLLARTLRRRHRRRRTLLAVGALVAPAGPADQIGLGRLERRRNLAGTLQSGDALLLAELRAAARRRASILLVDDVVTTGATLTEAARALATAGVTVSGAVVVADTPAGRWPGHAAAVTSGVATVGDQWPLTGAGRTV